MQFFVRIHQGGWSFADLERVWRAADELGYDGASLYDLLGTDGPECWTALAALTARTQHLTVVPLVLANPYRQPALVAKMAATLDVASGGRLILGLGAGGSPSDAAAFGLPFAKTWRRIEQLEEAVRLMRRLWRGGGSFAGEHYALDEALGAPTPTRPSGPRVLIGGHGPRLLGLIAREADVANVGFDLTAAAWQALRADLLAQRAAVGKEEPLVLSHNATVVVAPHELRLEHDLAALAGRRGVSVAALRDQLDGALVGTPASIVSRLATLEESGVEIVFLLFQDLPALDGLRLFAEAVMAPWHASRR